jgi:hypothetical protein
MMMSLSIKTNPLAVCASLGPSKSDVSHIRSFVKHARCAWRACATNKKNVNYSSDSVAPPPPPHAKFPCLYTSLSSLTFYVALALWGDAHGINGRHMDTKTRRSDIAQITFPLLG